MPVQKIGFPKKQGYLFGYPEFMKTSKLWSLGFSFFWEGGEFMKTSISWSLDFFGWEGGCHTRVAKSNPIEALLGFWEAPLQSEKQTCPKGIVLSESYF